MVSNRRLLALTVALTGLVALGFLGNLGNYQAAGAPAEASGMLAPTPPMGWNSFDCYWADVTEQEVKANTDYLASHLAGHGWRYIVVDYYWYFPHPAPGKDRDEENWEVTMDDYGRLLPAPNRFPSSANGQGFKPLGDYIHSKGLKFGIHIMRGIPRAAVRKNLPVLGTSAHAQDIVDLKNTCSWSTAMHGVQTRKPEGQAYYDSIVALYAKWGVDFIKADDMSQGENPIGETYHGPEIEALSRAIKKSGRPMVLSLSPGPTDPVHAEHVKKYSQMWRISDDFWDEWKLLKDQFALCRKWILQIGPNHWPDADMLPIGRIRIRGFLKGEPHTQFTPAEQRTMMTLWSIFRSPLMMGGDLPSLDPATLALLTNDEVLAVDQKSTHNREIFARFDQVAWAADVPGTPDKYLAVFNLADGAPAEVPVNWNQLGLRGKCAVRDLWTKKDLGIVDAQFAPKIEPHDAGLYRIKPAR